MSFESASPERRHRNTCLLRPVKQCDNIVFIVCSIITSHFNMIIIPPSEEAFHLAASKRNTNSEKFTFFILWLNDFLHRSTEIVWRVYIFLLYLFSSRFCAFFPFLKKDDDVAEAAFSVVNIYRAIIREKNVSKSIVSFKSLVNYML